VGNYFWTFDSIIECLPYSTCELLLFIIRIFCYLKIYRRLVQISFITMCNIQLAEKFNWISEDRTNSFTRVTKG